MLLLACGGGGGGRSQPAAEPRTSFRIEGLYLVQSTQNFGGTLPLVADRKALLRVFVTGPEGVAAPEVEVRLGNTSGPAPGEVLVRTIPAPAAGAPARVQEGLLARSWNLEVPEAYIQPGLTVRAELVEPGTGRTVTFPADGRPRPVAVRTVPPLRVTLIPVQHNGTMGEIYGEGRTLEGWTEPFRRMYPVNQVLVTVGAPIRAIRDLSPDQATMDALLEQLEEARVANGDQYRSYYYGVVKSGFTGNHTGHGNTAPPHLPNHRCAFGHDRSGMGRWTYAGTFAHEIGHLLGQMHAPSHGHGHLEPVGLDPRYPHAGGGIGVFGLDLAAMEVKAPDEYTDVMGYGSRAWISDYTWRRVLEHRANDVVSVAGPW
jgi:hypothetical protein